MGTVIGFARGEHIYHLLAATSPATDHIYILAANSHLDPDGFCLVVDLHPCEPWLETEPTCDSHSPGGHPFHGSEPHDAA